MEIIKKHLAAGVPSMFGFTVYDSIAQAQGSGKGRIPFPIATDRVAGGHVGYDDGIARPGTPARRRISTAWRLHGTYRRELAT